MSIFNQLKLLLWKNFLLQRRRPISTLFEVGLPVFFVLILLLLRIYEIKQEKIGAKVWDTFEVDDLPLHPPRRGQVWTIAYSPESFETTQVMQSVSKKLRVNIAGFKTEDDMVREVVSDEEKDEKDWKFLGGVYFVNNVSNSEPVYKIRLTSSTRNVTKKQQDKFFSRPAKWNTESAFPRTFDGLGPRRAGSIYGGPPDYYAEGFLALQRAVDLGIVHVKTNGTFVVSQLPTKLQRFPYPAYIRDPFIIVIQNSLPLLLMLSLVYPSLTMVRNVVHEKEKKLKESMKMMGLSGWLHWMAWFIKCLVMLLIPICFITIFLCVNFGGKGKMLMQSEPSLILFFLILYFISAIMFCFLVSSFFYRANIAAAAGGILWFLSYVPFFFVANFYDSLNVGAKLGACLDFNVAMGLASTLIGKFEGKGTGVQWSSLYDGVTVDENFSFGQVLLMLIVDSLLYGVLTWYIEGIYPGEYGVPLPWYFPFKKSYWTGEKQMENIPLLEADEIEAAREGQPQSNTYIEKDPEGLKAGIQMRNLRKIFDGVTGTKVAVQGTTLNMYEGQITALLGHNGAGKTTTVSMLTGLFPPTSGTAVINGFDIQANMPGVRKSLGICPQHNVLFDTLTVKEHLEFFAQLKGLTRKELLKLEVDRMIISIGLPDKTNVQSRNLSGGMKRKLSVGIALIADSKVVMLDEPTSGMDPAARRFTWDLLQKEREGRTMLLTTHFMDEADLLGDRIAIMADGVIKCCGSSLYLKNKYGVGYHMVIVKNQECKVDDITQTMKNYAPRAKLENNVGLELSYVLPSKYSDKFEQLFTEIENRRDELGIASYGASITTMEEVFLRVGEEVEEENVSKELYRQLSRKSIRSGDSGTTNQACELAEGVEVKFEPRAGTPVLHNFAGSCSTTEGIKKNTGWKLFRQRWYAMFVKRLLHSKRYKASLVSQLLMPSIFTLMALIVAKTFPHPKDSPALKLDAAMFKENFVPFTSLGSTRMEDMLVLSYKKQFEGTQTRIVNVTDRFNGNISEYLIEKSTGDLGNFNTKYLLGYSLLSVTPKKVNSTVLFNNQAFHSPAISLNAFDVALLKYATNKNAKITTINHPLPRTTQQAANELNGSGVGFNVAFNILFGMAFLASSFVIFLVNERASKAKHIQFVSGVDPISYWSSAYLWDMINFVLPILLIIILIAAFSVPAYSGTRLGYIFLLLFVYGWAIIPLMYMFSFLFKVASTAFVRLTMFNVITGLATLLTVNILSIPQLDLMNVARVLKYVFLVLPNYSLGQGLVDIFENYQYINLFDQSVDACMKRNIPIPVPDKRAFCEKVIKALLKETSNIQFQTNYLAWDNPGIARYLIFLGAEGFIFFTLVIMIEYGIFNIVFRICKRQITPTNGTIAHIQDEDVVAEKQRVLRDDGTNSDVLVMKNLTKVFGNFYKQLTAVDDLCLGIPQGECFGLLGMNGAGKTTTFRMLTGDESLTNGTVMIDSFDISTNLGKVRQRLGYCPQFDALIDLMTGREQLVMYARLRGVPEDKIRQTVNDLARTLTVEAHIDKLSKTYSGGNKRKLSTAMALVGDPPIVFLDEPTTGMDPGARRMLWDALSRQREEGKSIVITSHSMEECEALCTRLAIMVNGQFKCLGSPQHLKSKFGDGYTLLAKIGGQESDTRSLKQFVESTFPGSLLKDEHQGYVHYQIKDEEKSWARVFAIMEQAKTQFSLEDYSVSQTTLEQVFLNFVRYQREEDI